MPGQLASERRHRGRRYGPSEERARPRPCVLREAAGGGNWSPESGELLIFSEKVSGGDNELAELGQRKSPIQDSRQGTEFRVRNSSKY